MTISILASRTANRPARASIPFRTIFSVWAERRALAQMDVSRLKDMGISPQEAATEAARPFWDLGNRTGC